jgi:hypothetical protein
MDWMVIDLLLLGFAIGGAIELVRTVRAYRKAKRDAA